MTTTSTHDTRSTDTKPSSTAKTTAGKTTTGRTGVTDGLPAQLAYLTRVLKVPTVSACWEQLAEQARESNWSHEEYLAALLARQVADRESAGNTMRIRTAHFPQVKTLEDFNLDHLPSLRRDVLAHLATGTFVAKAENVILLGPPGIGKTHIAIGLGVKAAQAGHSVLFDTASNWTMCERGLGVREIARRIGRSPSTVSHELRRNMRRHDLNRYDADLAHARARQRARRARRTHSSVTIPGYARSWSSCWSRTGVPSRSPRTLRGRRSRWCDGLLGPAKSIAPVPCSTEFLHSASEVSRRALLLSTMNGTRGAPQASATLARMGVRVTPENVLQLRNALAAEVDRLSATLQLRERALHVGECGKDPLSRPVADAFNQKIQSLVTQMQAYVRELSGARDALHETALTYGHTEDQVRQSFDAFRATLPALYAQVAQQRQQQLPDRLRQLTAPPSPPLAGRLPGMFGGPT